MNSLLIILRPLIPTIIIESIVAYILKIRDKDELINIALINIITNTALTLIIQAYVYYFGIGSIKILTYIIVPILEVIIIVVESILFKKYLKKDRNYIVISFILNMSSYIGGIIWKLIENYL